MQNKDNQSKRIYLKATRQWVEVSEEYYRDHTRYYDAFRKRQQYHEKCVCPKHKFWLCDGDCCHCEFCRAGDMLSLNHTVENEEGDVCSPLDKLVDPAPSVEDIVCDKIELDHLFNRLNELMPEAIQIGKLRQEGLSDMEIANSIHLKRTTFLSRLKRVKEQFATEFPDFF